MPMRDRRKNGVTVVFPIFAIDYLCTIMYNYIDIIYPLTILKGKPYEKVITRK